MDTKFVWHPYTQMRDWKQSRNTTITRGNSFDLVDSEGNRYLDGIANMWCNVWGHSPNPVTRAIVRQFQKIPHSTLFGLASESASKVSSELVSLAAGMDKVFFTDNGSCAIEAAMKMAMQYWQNKGEQSKKKFVSLEHGYHGDTLGAMSVGYIEKFFKTYKPMLQETFTLPGPVSKLSGEDSSLAMETTISEAERLLSKKAHQCAALVMESGGQIAGGGIIYPRNFQKRISELCQKYDVLLILDEIATGFGRLGNMVEYVYQDSIPDIVCFGKALTGGYFPLAVTMTSNKIFDAFMGDYIEGRHFFHGHTFTGHAAGCAAALANINLYRKRGLMDKIRMNAKYLHTRLAGFRNYEIVSDIRHKGLFAAVEINARRNKTKARKSELMNYFIMKRGLELGVFLRPLGNNILLVPPLAMPRSKIELLVQTVEKIVSEIQDQY